MDKFQVDPADLNQERRSSSVLFEDDERKDERPAKRGKGLVIVDDVDASTSGCGLQDDPIQFRSCSTGNIILNDGKHGVVDISDDEDDGEVTEKITAQHYSPSLHPSRGASMDSDEDHFWWNSPPYQRSSSNRSKREAEDYEAENYDTEDDGITRDPIEAKKEDVQVSANKFTHWLNPRVPETTEEETSDDVPLLSLSQETRATTELQTPTASQGFKDSSEKEQDQMERKTEALYEQIPRQISRLQVRIERRYLAKVIGDRDPSECWLFVDDSLGWRNGRIAMQIKWQSKGQSRQHDFNIGFISMFLEGRMTDEIKEGIINDGWTASHLCGNWICLNPYHIHAEDLETNRSRNDCFPVEGCDHDPPCLKQYKIARSELDRLYVHRQTPAQSDDHSLWV